MEEQRYTYAYAIIEYKPESRRQTLEDVVSEINELGKQGYGLSGTYQYTHQNTSTGFQETVFLYMLIKAI